MRNGIIGALLALTLLVTSCSSKNDAAIVSHEMQAVTAIAQAEETRVEVIGEAHERSVGEIVSIEDATAGERILGIALLGRDLGDSARSQLEGILSRFKRATLGTDVQVKGLETVEKIAPILGMTTVAVTAVRNAPEDTTISSQGDVVNTDEENHSTALGEKSTATFNKEGDKPVVFEPKIPKEEIEIEGTEEVVIEE